MSSSKDFRPFVHHSRFSFIRLHSAQQNHRRRRARRYVVFAIMALAVWLGSQAAMAQNSDQDVHITPRTKPAPPPVANPALTSALEKTHAKPIQIQVDLVLVNVTVTDPLNRLVTGLEKENFVLAEENRLQAIRTFSSEDAPISLGVIFDMSGSMANKIEKSRAAVVEFFKTANPEDEFFLITFSDKPEVLADFTNSIEDIQGKLIYTVPKGRTALLDAVYLGITKMRDAKHSRKALLIISDGGDNRSRYTDSEIKSLVREADVQIYAVGLFDAYSASPEEQRGPFTLAAITDITGGRTITINNVNELSDVATKIGVELRNQYVLGYRPTDPVRNGKYRKIKVKLLPPKGLPQLNVHAKTGYYAPTE